MTKSSLETTLSVLITIAALSVAGVVIHREYLRGDRPASVGQPARLTEPVFVDSWERMLADGVHIGDHEGGVRLVKFTDLECPFCAAFHEGPLREALDVHDEPIDVTFMHLPLSELHRFAVPAAHAAECAHEQGRFLEFVDVVYAKQDSLGLRGWGAYAEDAMVPDVTRFELCLDGDPPARIAAGREWATALGITATPTVVINGWRLPTPPRTTEELLNAIEQVRIAPNAPPTILSGR